MDRARRADRLPDRSRADPPRRARDVPPRVHELRRVPRRRSGSSRTLIDFGIAPGVAYQLLVATAIVDASLLWTFFRAPRRASHDRAIAIDRARRREAAASSIRTASRALEGEAPAEILAWASGERRPAADVRDRLRRRGLRDHRSDRAREAADRSVHARYRRCCSPRPTRCGAGSRRATASRSARVRPAQTVDQQAAAHGPALWERDPDRCCELRKVAPLREALAGFDAWITAIRRDQTPERATAQVVEHDAQVRPRQDQPARRVDARRRVGAHLRERRPVQPAARARLSVDRLPAVHVGDRARREPARRSLARCEQARVRAPRRRLAGRRTMHERAVSGVPEARRPPGRRRRWRPGRREQARRPRSPPARASPWSRRRSSTRSASATRRVDRARVRPRAPRRRALGRRRRDARGQPRGRRSRRRARPVRQRRRRSRGRDRVPRRRRAARRRRDRDLDRRRSHPRSPACLREALDAMLPRRSRALDRRSRPPRAPSGSARASPMRRAPPAAAARARPDLRDAASGRPSRRRLEAS